MPFTAGKGTQGHPIPTVNGIYSSLITLSLKKTRSEQNLGEGSRCVGIIMRITKSTVHPLEAPGSIHMGPHQVTPKFHPKGARAENPAEKQIFHSSKGSRFVQVYSLNRSDSTGTTVKKQLGASLRELWPFRPF